MLLLAAAVMTLVIYTLVYIRRIRRKQHETLELYMALLNKPAVAKESVQPEPSSAQQARTEEDAMLKRIMRYVEENISNSDANVGDMAAAAATSRSGLQRKLRQTMGVTPQDLMHEARIKRACQLLRQSDKNISEVAYACGFTDPKYFSRSFKKSTGLSPTDYKNTS
jgi:AraC-like DNA-binding protein